MGKLATARTEAGHPLTLYKSAFYHSSHILYQSSNRKSRLARMNIQDGAARIYLYISKINGASLPCKMNLLLLSALFNFRQRVKPPSS